MLNRILSHLNYYAFTKFLVLVIIIILCTPEAFSYRKDKGLFSTMQREPAVDTSPGSGTVPTVLELQLYSSNACDPLLAVDNDQIICEFTLAEPCLLHFKSTADHEASGYLYCMQPDLQHWRFIFRIQNGLLPDQGRIRARSLLNWIFCGNYRYYGTCNDILYLAPLEITFQVSRPDTQATQWQTSPVYLTVTVTGNHSLIFLPPEQIYTEAGCAWTISVIDAGGNGPCCITVPLESPDTLLYNLTSLEACTYEIDLYRP